MEYRGKQGWHTNAKGAPTDRRPTPHPSTTTTLFSHHDDDDDNNNNDDDEDRLESNFSLDHILGIDHYLPPSPEHATRHHHPQPQRRRKLQHRYKDDQEEFHHVHRLRPSSSSNSTSTNPTTSLQDRYPFKHRIRTMDHTATARKLLKKLTDHKNMQHHRALKQPPPHKANALHILGANATTPAIQEDASAALWEEWVDGESHEKGLYNSIALECERRMSKAAVLSKHHGSPNSLRTAVAFDCLDKLGRVFSRYGMVFDTLRGELERSIYVDGIVSDKLDIEARTQTTTALMANATQHHRKKQAQEQRQQRHWDALKASLLGGDDGGEEEEEEEDPEVLYGQRLTFFEQSALLEVERARILNMANQLKETLEDWEANKKDHHHHHGKGGKDGKESKGHVWAELLERGRHENKVAMLLSQVSLVHSKFKKHTDDAEGGVEEALPNKGGRRKGISLQGTRSNLLKKKSLAVIKVIVLVPDTTIIIFFLPCHFENHNFLFLTLLLFSSFLATPLYLPLYISSTNVITPSKKSRRPFCI